jgi:hypothetical protein
MLVTDVLGDAGPDVSRWLDAAIDQDYELGRRERSELRAATAQAAKLTEMPDLELPAAELGDRVMTVLAVVRDYRDRVAAE